MVSRACGLVLLLVATAHADSAKLALARGAVDAVQYDDAQRLLVEALQDGDNSPAALGELYQLSARTAVVLGHAELAEQFYRRWLAIDPRAALPADSAPKLRLPFEAAQAYIAGHGHLTARAVRDAGHVVVAVTGDPLHMARAAVALEPPAAAIGLASDGTARLASAARRIAVLDELGNQLLALDVATAAPRPAAPPWAQRWTTWAVPSGLLAVAAGASLAVALHAQGEAARIATHSGTYHQSDAEHQVHVMHAFTWVSSLTALGMVACAIPVVVFYRRDHGEHRLALAPIVTPTSVGVALGGAL